MKNNAKSIRSRLYNISKIRNISFQHLIIRYLHERLLYRLSVSSYCNNFFLKGGTLLYAYSKSEKPRYTLDIDFSLQQMRYNVQNVVKAMRYICSVTDNDGVIFDSSGITANEIKENDPYGGLRVFVTAHLDTIQQRLQVDIGFGDIIYPDPVKIFFPVLLDSQASPLINAYTIETIIAEKFHSMIDLADLNSRMKDFYDVYKLIEVGDYSESVLLNSVRITFENRNTYYVKNHSLFADEFSLDKQRNKTWIAFTKKIEIENPAPFPDVMLVIRRVLQPIWNALA
ncbi:MAG: nucleotidyl transferase AbiEii/AbiGii toxin family protein [Marinilabiliales bacterium]|nr:MAG: nucleotidyl transferase AbiEii/AbiGii toxin family protein [Marinilabiliales bacterium]